MRAISITNSYGLATREHCFTCFQISSRFPSVRSFLAFLNEDYVFSIAIPNGIMFAILIKIACLACKIAVPNDP